MPAERACPASCGRTPTRSRAPASTALAKNRAVVDSRRASTRCSATFSSVTPHALTPPRRRRDRRSAPTQLTRGLRGDDAGRSVPSRVSDVELAVGVLAERRERRRPSMPRSRCAIDARRPAARAPIDVRPAVVAEDVHAVERGDRRAAVHVAADDRAVAVVVRRLDDRVARAAGRCAPSNSCKPSRAVPAPVDALLRRARREVDLFVRVLADVADPHVAGRAVEREAPRVAQARTSRSRGRAPARPTNGLSAGIVYGAPPLRRRDRCAGSCRAACRGSGRCRAGRPPLPPSPRPM